MAGTGVNKKRGNGEGYANLSVSIDLVSKLKVKGVADYIGYGPQVILSFGLFKEVLEVGDPHFA